MGKINHALLFDEGHHLNDEGIALYVDALKHGRTGALPSPVLEHVQVCLPCKQEITDLYSLMAEIDRPLHGEQPVSDRHTPRTADRRMIYKMAAAIVVVLGLGALTFALLPRSPDGARLQDSRITSVTQDTTQVGTQREIPERMAPQAPLLASRFEPSPDLEDLVTDRTRSGETAVHSPANDAVLHADIRFSWDSHLSPPFTVTVLDNRRHTVHTAQCEAESLTLKQRLTPGLYYWKLSAEGELVHVGKFIVN